MNINKRAIFELTIGLIGLLLFWDATNWEATIGLYLMMLSNNIGQRIL
jgi:hypothetical protein